MAFIAANLYDIDTQSGTQYQWQYFNVADSLTTIRGSGYFPSGDISVNDIMLIAGSEGTQTVTVTGVSPVTVDLVKNTISLTLAANPVPTDTITVPIELGRFGNKITLCLPELNVAGNNNAALITYSTIPAVYRPRSNHEMTTVAVRDSGTYTEAGVLRVSTAGVITIGLTNASTADFIDPTNFSATVSNVGHQGIYITYLVA